MNNELWDNNQKLRGCWMQMPDSTCYLLGDKICPYKDKTMCEDRLIMQMQRLDHGPIQEVQDSPGREQRNVEHLADLLEAQKRASEGYQALIKHTGLEQ